MDDATRAVVAARAGHSCEYCLLHENDDIYSFHVEHIIAIKHGGSNESLNLAFACQFCNLHKGPNLSGVDPETGKIVELSIPDAMLGWSILSLAGFISWVEHRRDGPLYGCSP